MRYLTFSRASDGVARLGAQFGDRIVDVATAVKDRWSGPAPDSLLGLIQQGPDAWQRSRELLGDGTGHPADPISAIRWHAPIPRTPKNVFCLGLNYLAHAQESAQARGRAAKVPTVPVFFTKAPTSINGPFDDVPVDWSVTQQVDWEVELGVVIGRGGRNIPRTEALSHVFGYTVVNDVSARDAQVGHFQWFKGKSLDGFCPVGPVVVTADEYGDPQHKRLTCRVNGVTKQEANTSNMIFPVAVIIEWLSKGMTIDAGDLIASGTPEGVGMGRTPPEYLKDGDIVETDVEGIGMLRNRIRTA